jgi:hypothetical protein
MSSHRFVVGFHRGQSVPHTLLFEFGSPRPTHSATSRRETVKLVPLYSDEICSEEEKQQEKNNKQQS